MRGRRPVSYLLLVSLVFGSLVVSAGAQNPTTLEDKVIAENRELDRQLVEAHNQKDTDKVLGCFSGGPDTFMVGPQGAVHRGREAIRQSYTQFFAGLDSIRGEIKEVSYFPAGKGVIALGTVIFYRHPKNAPPDQRTVVWTDYRRRENGKWVYVFRHAHWPLASNPQLTAAPPIK